MGTFGKMHILHGLMLCFWFSIGTMAVAQGLNGVRVETYYIADANDAAADPGQTLKAGAVTYRIFVHLKSNYKLLTVYGAPGHPMYFRTSTYFYNNSERSKQTGSEFSTLHLPLHTSVLDSYLAFGGASRRHIAVPKELDTDGSIFKETPVDSSQDQPKLLLRNVEGTLGIPLFTSDGLLVEEKGVSLIHSFGDLNLQVFGDQHDANEFFTENGAYALIGGMKQPETDNHILIAQLTTDGSLSFKLNIQIQSDEGITEYFVAERPEKKQSTHPELIYPNPLKP